MQWPYERQLQRNLHNLNYEKNFTVRNDGNLQWLKMLYHVYNHTVHVQYI